jgi:hypothetical protein
MDNRLWTIDYGLWFIVYGQSAMDNRLWTIDYGLWSIVYGQSAMVYGLWTFLSHNNHLIIVRRASQQ